MLTQGATSFRKQCLVAEKKWSGSIRRAVDRDCAGILECLQLAFAPYRSEYTSEAFLDTILTPESLQRRMTEMTIVVAIASEQIAGTIAWSSRGSEGHLRGMAVRLELQGSGVSTQLLQAALDGLRRAGCTTVTLDTTRPLQRAIRFYEKNGFSASGKVEDFFGMPLYEYRRQL